MGLSCRKTFRLAMPHADPNFAMVFDFGGGWHVNGAGGGCRDLRLAAASTVLAWIEEFPGFNQM